MENKYERDNILDIIGCQEDSSIQLYDLADIHNYEVYSLDYKGSKNTKGKNYNQLINNNLYKYRVARFKNINISEVKTNSPFLHIGIARLDFELIP